MKIRPAAKGLKYFTFFLQDNICPVTETLEQAFLQIRINLRSQIFRVDLYLIRTNQDKNFPFHLQNLEDDEEFQQALKTSHGQRPGVVSYYFLVYATDLPSHRK